MTTSVMGNRRTRRAQAARARRVVRTTASISPAPDLGRPAVRGRIAETVHRAVCEFSGTDGCGHCMLYAIAGAGLLGRVFGTTFHPQAGSLSVLADPPNHWMTMDASNFANGEFHCWLGRPSGGGGAELIDFAARHYRTYCERLLDVSDFQAIEPGIYVRRDEPTGGLMRPTWNRAAPPDYVWVEGLLSEWLGLVPDHEATEAVWANMLGHLDEYDGLVRLAVEHFRRVV